MAELKPETTQVMVEQAPGATTAQVMVALLAPETTTHVMVEQAPGATTTQALADVSALLTRESPELAELMVALVSPESAELMAALQVVQPAGCATE
ncbi:hypothetical protein PR002_g23135 [Phytophthora rubi]|uniref:Uncharacterized protein n=1 Tax=Phytophthora rubi TaxID=129364 RepID=A0A6A3ILJ9_9STRA|nr:hypothetical protein PR002_g23135 [Phytophthora rubi]